MGQIKVEKNVGGIHGLCIIEPAVHGDSRGYFMETYNQKDMEDAGLAMNFVQDNQSSSSKGVLRGLHYQKEYPQGKLVRVIKQFYIPEGFAHGFLVLSDVAEFCYKCTDFYHPGDEGGLAWNDPEIGICWPQVAGEYRGSASADGYRLEDGTGLILSEKDQMWDGFRGTFKF